MGPFRTLAVHDRFERLQPLGRFGRIDVLAGLESGVHEHPVFS